MSPRSLPYPVFDIDNHMYETEEALTKFLPKEHQGKVGYVEVNGRPKLVVKDHISHMIPNPTFARVARPGSAEDYFLGNNPEGLNFREFIGEAMDVIPAYQAPAPRLELMDELGMDRCVMYPTLASLIEERTTDDVILTHAVIHALNEWMHEHWTFDYEGRIFATPGDLPAVGGQGDQGIPLVPRAQHEDLPDPPGAGAKSSSVARGRWACPSSIRSGRRWSTPAFPSPCTPRTAGTRSTSWSGRAATSTCPSSPARCARS